MVALVNGSIGDFCQSDESVRSNPHTKIIGGRFLHSRLFSLLELGASRIMQWAEKVGQSHLVVFGNGLTGKDNTSC